MRYLTKHPNPSHPQIFKYKAVYLSSVLGPLFFLIFKNDLAFISELHCKMFADDTTLVDGD